MFTKTKNCVFTLSEPGRVDYTYPHTIVLAFSLFVEFKWHNIFVHLYAIHFILYIANNKINQ